ncbi:MAG: TetR/AcrR family transcriptional regulator [Solirubrobacterales bacterium]
MTTTLQAGRKATQRERLLTGMMTAANRGGYAGANVSNVIAEAGVSRPTFYDYFADKDDCFLAALTDVHERLLGEIRKTVGEESPEHAMRAAIRALIWFAGAQPAMARFLCNEPMAAGPIALDARDRGIADIERVIEESYQRVDPATPAPDFSARMLIGGVYRLLASRLRRGEPGLSTLRDDLLGWIDSYERPLGEHRWRTLKPGLQPSPSPFVPETPLRAPEALAPGRPRISEGEVAENQRLRIMFAAAQLAEDKGYTATTIADITKQAGIDGRAFYSMFADKQDAFMAVHELGFQRVMEVTAGAFFAGSTWPERNWEAGRAFTQFLEQNPTVAHVGFVEAYAVGPGAAQRLEDSHTAFAMLLQEGYQHVAEEARPPPVVLEAIITTIFETVYDRTRDSGTPRLSGLLAHLTFLVLSPFLGASEASAFIDEKLEALATS